MIGVPSLVALGLIAGIGEFIPYVGAAVAAVVKNRPQTFNEMLQSCLLHPPTIPIEAPNSLVRLRPRLRQLPKAMWSGPLSTQAGESRSLLSVVTPFDGHPCLGVSFYRSRSRRGEAVRFAERRVPPSGLYVLELRYG